MGPCGTVGPCGSVGACGTVGPCVAVGPCGSVGPCGTVGPCVTVGPCGTAGDVSGPAKVGKYLLPKRRQLMAQLRDGGLYQRMQQCRLGFSVILIF